MFKEELIKELKKTRPLNLKPVAEFDYISIFMDKVDAFIKVAAKYGMDPDEIRYSTYVEFYNKIEGTNYPFGNINHMIKLLYEIEHQINKLDIE